MTRTFADFKDILEPRRRELSNFMWVSRELNPIVPYKQSHKPTPKKHKHEVLICRRIQDIAEKIAKEKNVPKGSVIEQIRIILEEIGYNRQLSTIRWLGLALTKICLNVTSGIHVNESGILKLRSQMGNTPVIYVPSHRSYADFILMSYVLFSYDIEIPAIAAGMDFHAMWGMGAMLRDTGAFFMRRSYNNDSLYWETFRQYVYQLVTRGENGIEFFIEGTRSRSNKSLVPKYGLLSMILKAFFNSEVPDILFCPINITYDRILEERLFAFELLGVPKPKESTSGFFKSLSIIKENYGNYYMDFGETISAREFFDNKIDRSIHSLTPNHLQKTTEKERHFTTQLACTILNAQQKLCVVTMFNLVAIISSFCFGTKQNLKLFVLVQKVHWLKTILQEFGALIESSTSLESDILKCFQVHQNLIYIDEQNCVTLRQDDVILDKINHAKLKGHELSEKTMTMAVPFVMLQLYVNPVMHYLIDTAILTTILICSECVQVSKDALFCQFHFLRSLLAKEFVCADSKEQLVFEEALNCMSDMNILAKQNTQSYSLGEEKNLIDLLTFLLEPSIVAYANVLKVLNELGDSECEEKVIFARTQAKIETLLHQSDSFQHPYTLNLDSLSNCLQSLISLDAIGKIKKNNGYVYKVIGNKTSSVMLQMETFSNKLLTRKPNAFFKNKL